jgi:tetratricopeptide (TPR) repeat protein
LAGGQAMLLAMKLLKFAVLTLILTLLAACQSSPPIVIEPQGFMYDRGFKGFEQVKVETEAQVFELNQEAKDFVEESVGYIRDPVDGMETLIHKIFNRSEYNLLYQGSANTTASQTFQNRAANCLSMSIMTYALATEAGFGVRFQDIEIPEYWTRREGYSLLNGHVNLQLLPKPELGITYFQSRGFQVDFDPQSSKKNFPKKFISKQLVLAMFYNNKGADALLKEAYTEAYAYFRAATMLEPTFDSAWVNLGLLYRLSGFYQRAEDIYKLALQIEPQNLTTWENLAFLYEFTNRHDKASEILVSVERKRISNPYYHLILGEQEFESDNYDLALSHYRKALSLDKTKHEIYFGLAKVYYQLGEVERSQVFLKKAKRISSNQQEQDKYQGKLDLMSKL